MNNDFPISIPSPCSEGWNKMTVQHNGRFCATCAKCVIDFTQKSKPEITDYLLKHRGQEICGRFSKAQLDGIRIAIPKSVFRQKMPFHRAFVLVLFATMGSMLFSCTEDDGSISRIDSVEITDDVYGTAIMGAISVPYYYVENEPTQSEYNRMMLQESADGYFEEWDADTTATVSDLAPVSDTLNYESATDFATD